MLISIELKKENVLNLKTRKKQEKKALSFQMQCYRSRVS